MIPEHLNRSAEQLLAEMLATVPNVVDKRIGSIIYDTLAASALQLAEAYAFLRKTYKNTYALSAEDEFLDLRVGEIGIYREEATYAVREGHFSGAGGIPFAVGVGSRFSAIGSTHTFVVREQLAAGLYALVAEQAGAAGNDYIGQLLPLTHIPGLQVAELLDILAPGSDRESDDRLLERYLERLRLQPFAGNIVAYRQMVGSLPGVGGVQVYPVWQGGGTVKCSITDSNRLPPSEYLVAQVQEEIDPAPQSMGLGRAPINHEVTIQGAAGFDLEIEATIHVAAGFTLEQLRPLIVDSLESYITEIRQNWDRPPPRGSLEYIAWVFRSRLNSQFFAVPGVLNVENLLLNGSANDIRLVQDIHIQQLPLLREVNLHEPS